MKKQGYIFITGCVIILLYILYLVNNYQRENFRLGKAGSGVQITGDGEVKTQLENEKCVNCAGDFTVDMNNCSPICGTGTKDIKYKISTQPSNGGKPCPHTENDTIKQACDNGPCIDGGGYNEGTSKFDLKCPNNGYITQFYANTFYKGVMLGLRAVCSDGTILEAGRKYDPNDGNSAMGPINNPGTNRGFDGIQINAGTYDKWFRGVPYVVPMEKLKSNWYTNNGSEWLRTDNPITSWNGLTDALGKMFAIPSWISLDSSKSYNVECPDNQVLSGMKGYQDDHITKLNFYCTPHEVKYASNGKGLW